MTKRVFALLISLLSICNVYANTPVDEGNQISGHVIEAGSEYDIPGASVLIIELNRGTVADENGQFAFKNIAAGVYTIKVTAMGYKAMEKQITVSRLYAEEVLHFSVQMLLPEQSTSLPKIR